MIKLLKLLVMLVFVNTSVFATTFVPLTIKNQINSADGIVVGEIVNTTSYEHESGRIHTRAFVKADKWIGNKVKNDHIEINFPGGKIGSQVFQIHGAPRFENGEKVVLFTKKINGNVYVNNLGLGKFSVKNLGKTQIMVNQVYPNMPEVGQMEMGAFYRLSENLKNRKFSERFKNKYERNIEKQTMIKTRKSNSRQVASIEPKKKEKNELADYWLVILLGALSMGYSFMRRKPEQ